MVVFALKDMDRFFSFSCVSSTEEEFARRVDRAYWNWKACQPQGSNKPLSEFLKGKTKVRVTVEEYA